MSKIAQKLDMKTASLIRLNPDVNGEPRANSFLVVPEKKLNNLKNTVKQKPETVTDSIVDSNKPELTEEEQILEDLKEKYEIYEVKKGDTFFNIKKRFGVTRGELLLLNPELKEGLKLGMILKLKENPVEILLTDEDYYNDYIDSDTDLKVALL
ncbi:LysM peptidoglycan-binding domain-containing protein, partial [Polaribacter sp.]|uniref:LysM peptidoglycan-binding domain-containing protein n=1 Tax=Polaribacter sp. TaxID=1920175 RepID=UPI003F6AEAD0